MHLLTTDFLALGLIGLLAGVLGGLLGLGGSIIMIPALSLLFAARGWSNQHLYQAAAMIANVVISIPGAVMHRRAGTVPHELIRWLLPSMCAFIVLGVLLSNLLDDATLRGIFAAFLVYVAAVTIWKVIRRAPDHEHEAAIITPARGLGIGAVTGTMGGLLGIGGGVLAVPLMQWICRLPMKRAIAASASVMVISSAIGATFKSATLGQHGVAWTSAVILAACLAPTAVIGGLIGARLSRTAPLTAIRVVFGIVVLATAARMSGLL